ncbi:hypothetical protein C0992_010962 [Termitomyces sp. T32_za158]|nr:hypothetical protein C0992_010962 [Termitomyces sp. T32_za158]
MSISLALAKERNEGLYAAVADSVVNIHGSFLGGAKFGIDFKRCIEQWSGNYIYKDSQGRDFRTNIVGEIASTSAGTIIAAKGNYYAGRPNDQFRPIGDESKVKDVLVIKVPTESPRLLSTLFNNQILTLSADFSIREWIRNSDGDDLSKKDHIVVHMLPKYANPIRNRIGTNRSKKRPASTPDTESTTTLSSDASSEPIGEQSLRETTNANVGQVPVVHTGGFYDPRLNEDYRGPYFNLVHNKLVQLDVRDEENELVAPWQFYDRLKPGTLVLLMCSLHCFVLKDRTPIRKIYQINAHSLRILSPSDGPPIERVVPTLPTHEGDNATGSGVSTAVVDAFTNFAAFKRRRMEDTTETGAAEASTPTGIKNIAKDMPVNALTPNKKVPPKKKDTMKNKKARDVTGGDQMECSA